MTDFFGSQRPVELMDGLLQNYNLTASSDEGGKGVGTTSGVQTADEPKAFSMPTGQQAKQLDEHDHLVSSTCGLGDIAYAHSHTHLECRHVC